MTIATSALNLLAFPQRWNNGVLTLRWLCLPRANPLLPLAPGLPPFHEATLRFEARLIGSLNNLPRAADSVAAGPDPLDLVEPPLNKASLFDELTRRFTIDNGNAPAGPAAPRFRKPVTASYRALVGSRGLSDAMADTGDYRCALHAAHDSQPAAPAVLRNTLRWGELLAFALRQPKLAAALGLTGQAQVALPDAAFFARGGWVYVALHPSSDGAGDLALVSSYAARLGPLDAERNLYAAMLFPVDGATVGDDAFRDAERYERGHARLVHAAQAHDSVDSDQAGDGIRLGWDDEHVAGAFSRQLDAQTSTPMGTAGYRVDVRNSAGDGSWHSLQSVQSRGPLMLGDLVIGDYAGESVVEVAPARVSPALPSEFWIPPYFCTWRGSSLVLTDPDLTRLHSRAGFDPEFDDHRLNREQVFDPVDDKAVPLRYGQSYDFRVRMADLSRGGPPPDDPTPSDSDRDAHHQCQVAFRRHRRPGPVEVLSRPSKGDLRLLVARPLLGHPELLYTGAHSIDDIEAAVDASAARFQAPGLPDPDVLQLRITVEVRALNGDAERWWPLYTVDRDFAGAQLSQMTLLLALQDVATLDGFVNEPGDDGSLPVPTSRDLRLVLVAVGRSDAGYFASDAARLGLPVTVELQLAGHAAGPAEGPLLPAAPSLLSLFFRSAGRDASVPRPLARLVQEAGLQAQGLTLGGTAGQRTVFGCAAALRHVLSPERSSLTLGSDTDLAQRWTQVIQFTLARDWSWDGLAKEGVVVNRRLSRPGRADVVELAGTMTLPQAVTGAALPADTTGARAPVRQLTRLVFIDAIDPKPLLRPAPEPAEFPQELTLSYEISFLLRDGLPAPETAAVATLLPVTTPPVQVPQLVSAGIALSPHVSAADYSSTDQRERMLWLEFEAPPADPDDSYFVRVLACAADPLLTQEMIPETTPEPALPLDPEWVRVITPGQPRDDNGLRAMTPLLRPSQSGAHYLIPLPEGLSPGSAELFSLYTYEVRLGHSGSRWSTAQGRYGPALRVAGVQHPPPPLACQAARSSDGIRVRAPFATPVQEGRHVRPARRPMTRLWALLYARVEQADALAWRNLMLMRTPLLPPSGGFLAAVQPPSSSSPLMFGEGRFLMADLQSLLARHGLDPNSPLTTLVAEFHTEPEIEDPLGSKLGHARILRVSPLIAVPDAC